MSLDRLFDLARSETMSRHVDDIVGTAKNVVITVFVLDAPVERGVNLRLLEQREVGRNEAVIVAPDRRETTGRQR